MIVRCFERSKSVAIFDVRTGFMRRDDEEIREAARRAARRGFREKRGKKPPTTVHLVRL